MSLPNLSLPISLDHQRARGVTESFEASQIEAIFGKYSWMNDMANATKAAAESVGWEKSSYVSNACGVALGGLVLDDQGICLDATSEDIVAATLTVGTSAALCDGFIVGTDGESFGSEFQRRNPVYAAVIESAARRVKGDMFIVGATLTYMVAEAIRSRKRFETVMSN